MPQDQHMKHVHEQERQEHKTAREQTAADEAINTSALAADNHTGQQGLLAAEPEQIEGVDVKNLHKMLTDFTNDELRRIVVVPPGTRLKQGGRYCDLRFRESGELVAHGEEEVHDELLVAKNEVDYEIWNKLLRKPSLAG